MALTDSSQLYQDALQGKKLTQAERRQAIAYLDIIEPGFTNVALAKIFQVTERAVRHDRVVIKKKLAKDLKEEFDPTIMIVDLETTFRNELRDLQRIKHKAKEGSEVRLRHSVAIVDMFLKVLKAYQDFGIMPKNATAVYKQSYNYITIVDENGGIIETKEARTLTKEINKEISNFDMNDIHSAMGAIRQEEDTAPLMIEERVNE